MIGQEFLKALEKEGLTYIAISFIAELVKIFQLSLALVELIKISLVKSNSSMGLIDFNTEVVLYPLNGHVLSQRSELAVEIQVVGCLVFPFRLQQL